jgi:hypothetical protein
MDQNMDIDAVSRQKKRAKEINHHESGHTSSSDTGSFTLMNLEELTKPMSNEMIT